jgi:hypothetical protein
MVGKSSYYARIEQIRVSGHIAAKNTTRVAGDFIMGLSIAA